MSRFKYVEYAYGDMAKWMQQGTEEEKKLKRYIHRYLDIPKSCLHPPEKKDDAKEILMEFGYHYTTALLNYCSDHLKDGMFAILTLSHSLTQSHTSYTLTRTHRVLHHVRPHDGTVQETPSGEGVHGILPRRGLRPRS